MSNGSSFNPDPKERGDLIRAEDWNEAMEEIVRLAQETVSRRDFATGPLTVAAFLDVRNDVLIGQPQTHASLTVNGTVRATRFELNDGTEVGRGGLSEGEPVVANSLSVAPQNEQRGALFLATMGDFNHALYNNYSNIDGEGQWDGSKWNTLVGLNIRVGSGDNKKSALVINWDGLVGLGSTNPATPLAVRGNGGQYDVGMTQNQVGGPATMELTTADQAGAQATRLLLRGNSDAANIEFYRGARGAEALSIVIDGESGSVGIGTDMPAARLEVKGGETLLEQESWLSPVEMQNGWVRYSAQYNPPEYFKDSQGMVHLRGLIKDGSKFDHAATIFVLPEGYRPAYRQLHVVSSNSTTAGVKGGTGRVDVLANGHVVAVEGNAGWFSLDDISFRAVSLEDAAAAQAAREQAAALAKAEAEAKAAAERAAKAEAEAKAAAEREAQAAAEKKATEQAAQAKAAEQARLARIAQAQAELQAAQARANQASAALQRAQRELDTITQKRNQISAQITQLETQANNLRDQFQRNPLQPAFLIQSQVLTTQAQTMRSALAATDPTYQTARAAIQQAQAQANQANAAVQAAQAKLAQVSG